MADSGSIALTPSAKAWKGEVVWEVSDNKLYLSLYMWKTDGTNSPSSGGYANTGSVTLDGSTVINFTYDQIEYNRTQYGETYVTSFRFGESYSVSASVGGLYNTGYSGTTLSGSGEIFVDDASLYANILRINQGEGTVLTVERVESKWSDYSSDNNKVYLSDRDTVYYNSDYLAITAEALEGYEIDYYNHDGDQVPFELVNLTKDSLYDGYYLTSNNEASITTTATAISTVRINNGSGFERYSCYINDGSDWHRYIPYIHNGTSWDRYS